MKWELNFMLLSENLRNFVELGTLYSLGNKDNRKNGSKRNRV